MIRIVRNPPHHFVITNLPACVPAIAATQTSIQADPTVESIADMDHSLQPAPLDSDMIHAGHEAWIEMYPLSDRDAAHGFAALNLAQMDAGVTCWESTNHSMIVRPNHPSYPSGQSTFSYAAAVSLAYFSPAEVGTLWQMAEEAPISRS